MDTPDVVKEIVTSKNAEIPERDRETEKQPKEASQEQIKKAVSEINRAAMGTEAVFGIHEATNRVTIKIVDKDTKEVVKEFPPDKTLDMIAKAWELAGIMVDEKK